MDVEIYPLPEKDQKPAKNPTLLVESIPPSTGKATAVTTFPQTVNYILPVEIWLHIFSFTSTFHSYPFDSEYVFSRFFPIQDEEPMSGAYSGYNAPLIHARRSIILVCRFWYSVGLPILWSHIQVDLESTNILRTIYNQLVEKPTLASFVTRFTVKIPRQYDLQLNSLYILVDILSMLPNLSILELPLVVISELPPSLWVRSAIIYDYGDWFYFPAAKGLFLATFSRSILQSLSFSCTKLDWGPRQIDYITIVFDNLCNLRLYVTNRNAIDWIASSWSTPVLKRLSIRPARLNDTIPKILIKNRLTLEKLDIPWRLIRKWEDTMTLDMPKLQEIHFKQPINLK